jgi:hypothetical protein
MYEFERQAKKLMKKWSKGGWKNSGWRRVLGKSI